MALKFVSTVNHMEIDHMITHSGHQKIGAGGSILIFNEKAANV